MNSIPQETFRLLYMGGCHVEGYGIGQPLSFVNVAKEDLFEIYGIDTINDVKAYVNLRDYQKAIDHILIKKPNILILQLGNYEFKPRISWKQYFKNLITGKKEGFTSGRGMSVSGNSVSPIVNPSPTISGQLVKNFDPYYKYKPVDSIIKKALSPALYLINRGSGLNRIDLKTINTRLHAMFSAIKNLNLDGVIVLSPLPYVDDSANVYRTKGGKIFQALCKQYGFTYVDSHVPLLQTRKNGNHPLSSYFIDVAHFNGHGHKALGSYVGKVLANLIKDIRPNNSTLEKSAAVKSEI